MVEGDEIVGLVKVEEGKTVILVTDKGKGKQVDFELFMKHGRGTMGQKIYNLPNDAYLVSALGVNDENDLVCITKKGQTIRTHVNGISSQGRNAGGVNIFRMKTDDDYIVAMTVTDYQEDEPEEDETAANIEIAELGTNAEALEQVVENTEKE